MPNYSACGIDCDTCYGKTDHNCQGCKTIRGNVFWGKCELYQCSADKHLEHCGKCAEFPCSMLKEWAKSENPERIDNLSKQSAS